MDGLDYVTTELNKSLNGLVADLEAGRIQTFEDYKFVTGQIRGVKHALTVIEEYITKREEDDE
jgi:hypothetical protein